jgi:hypothetical protein
MVERIHSTQSAMKMFVSPCFAASRLEHGGEKPTKFLESIGVKIC